MNPNVNSKNIKTNCSICTNNVLVKNIIKCPYCQFEACKSCVKRFLMEIDDDRPRCMNVDCKKIWTFEFISDNFKPNFHNKKYRERRAKILYEREKSLLPGTQILVAQRKKIIKDRFDINIIYKENNTLKLSILENKHKIKIIKNDIENAFLKNKLEKKDSNVPKKNLSSYLLFCLKIRNEIKTNEPTLSNIDITKELGKAWKSLSKSEKAEYVKEAMRDKERYDSEMKNFTGKDCNITDYKKKIVTIKNDNKTLKLFIKENNEKISFIRNNNEKKEETEQKTKFTRACPVETCRGFLSTSLKCGTCNIYACKDCHLEKNGKNDNDHKCDPDLVATVKLLAQDTKPCPACATLIYKIHGCDQMYCTQCHTAFSWEKGSIERGIIHNPHFYEAQRAMNNGIAPSRQVLMRCGGPPPIQDIRKKLVKSNVQFDFLNNSYALIHHINIVELPHYPNVIGNVDNSNLRVRYLMNYLTDKEWISKLKTKMKKQEKNGEINMVLSMFTTTLSDIFGNITNSTDEYIPQYIISINDLREYTNKALNKIGDRYENVYPFISHEYKFLSNKNNMI